jgi:glycosyltransferase involved in cell wall biosynthesis
VAAGERPQITVIVPARDASDTLPALFDSLDRQTLERDAFEVIVIDNASRDDTAAVARARGAVVVEEPQPSRSRARNAGVRAARADLIAYTDADCVATPGWLAALRDALAEHALVAGPVHLTTGQPPNAVERFEGLWRFAQEAGVKDGWAATANLGIRRSAHEDIDGFDVTYRQGGEDVDYCLRAGAKGHKISYAPDAVIEHYAESELRPMLKRAFVHGYSVHQINRRYGLGYRAWRRPEIVLRSGRSLTQMGLRPDAVPRAEWNRMRELARAYYGMRALGSAWAEIVRVR